MPELNADTLVFGFIWYVAFLFSTTCHEASHALVAKIGGDDTAARGGQITLNPIPHIQREPWGMVVIPLLGCFNLLPVPPLDGSAGIMVLMGHDTAHRYLDWLRTTPYRSLGLLVAILGFRYLYGPIEAFATNLLIFAKF